MENNNNRSHSKKVRNLVILSFLCALVLGVSTYAWFIGMKTVNVSTFEVKVATTEGLYISLDAESWAYNLDINTAKDYTNNTNFIKNVELIPISTIGKIDKQASTMIMYEKGSLTATGSATSSPLGYRLLASRVNNWIHTDDNGKLFDFTGSAHTGQENPEVAKTGYLVFDLFIKNVSGEEYYIEDNKENEEAIYLTTNSKVAVGTTGIEGTGIENSVRVAFAQIGRVEDVTTNYGAPATSITCASNNVSDDGKTAVNGHANETTTGICRDAYIWEPNDTKHVDNAKNWYKTSTGNEFSTLADANGYVTTYAIGDVITAPGIDIYATSTQETVYGVDTDTTSATGPLYKVNYFTDTEKMLQGTARPQFMSLAPNSITKVRVYVYLEGQDIDNYDFAQLGKQISVQFGFTKERFQEDNIDYSGPNTYITPTDSATIVDHNGRPTNGTEIEEGYENDVTGSSIPGNRQNTSSIQEAYR